MRESSYTAAKEWFNTKSKTTVSQDQLQLLVTEFQETREKYLDSNPDPTAAIERRRSALLAQITRCQNKILFEVSDSDLISRLVPFAIEQTTSLYAISKESEFALIEMGIGQLDSILPRNASYLQARSNHRSLAVFMTVVIILLIVLLIASSSYIGISIDTVVPMMKIPLPIILWSVLGSMGAMLYRFNTSADAELADPLRWCFTRPLTGILMGIIAYMVFKVGILVLQPASDAVSAAHGSGGAPQELLWLAAFLAGFSDRFADSVLRSLAGRLGGDRQGDLVVTDRPSSTTVTLNSIAERLGIVRTPTQTTVGPALPSHNVAAHHGPPTNTQRTAKPEPEGTPKADTPRTDGADAGASPINANEPSVVHNS